MVVLDEQSKQGNLIPFGWNRTPRQIKTSAFSNRVKERTVKSLIQAGD